MKNAAPGSACECSPARISALGACLLLAVSLPAAAAYRIDIDAPRELKSLLEDHLDLARYRERKDLSPDQFEFMISSAPQRVAALLATEGYFSPKTSVQVSEEAGAAVVRVHVAAGKRTLVSAVKLDVDGPATEISPRQVARLSRNWLLPAGQPFRQENWEEAKHEGLRILQRRRYAAARLAASEARINADTASAELEARYDSGPVFTLGEVEISGTSRYPATIVNNVNPLQPGEEYSVDRLLEYQRQILRTPYFSNVVIDIDKDPARAERVPVRVQVSEFPKQRVRGGAGFTTDTGAHLDGRYSHNDVFRRAWVLDLQTRLEQERQLGALELAMPPDHRAWVNSGNLSLERTTLEGVELRSRRMGVRRSRKTDQKDLQYSIQHYRDRLQQLSDASLPPDTVLEPGAHQALVTSAALTRRRVDNSTFPRDGRIVTVELGVALKGLATDQTFTRVYGNIREFFPIGRRHLVIARAELGGVISKGGNAAIPASLMFRAGGTDSVRGYAFQSIGNERDGTVYPTRFVLTGSVEYQHWFDRRFYKQQLGAAVFYDAGTATDRWTERPLFHAVGLGARWRSPVGRVNADLAYGFQGKTYRPHISLGVAF